MSQVSVLGIDLAKQVFHVVGMHDTGTVVWRKRLTRSALMPFIARIPRLVKKPKRMVSSAFADLPSPTPRLDFLLAITHTHHA
jgi:hypothetical protein